MKQKLLVRFPEILVFSALLLVYIFLFLYINPNIFENSSFPYYSSLLDAIFKGRLDVIPPSTIDMSYFHGKWFLNWGPGPILFILPFKFIFQPGISDKIYTFIAGFSNIIIFYFFLREFVEYFKIKLSNFSRFFILISFALTSPNLYLSLNGRVWFTEQILAVFYILFSLFLIFKFLNTKKILYFSLSIIFFNLAWLSRAPLIFHGILLLFVVLKFWKDKIFFKLILILMGI